MHEDRRAKCVFGCVQEDSLDHYLCCPVLAMSVAVSLAEPLPIPSPTPSFFLPCPLNTRKDILRIFIAYHTYHSMKQNVSSNFGQRYLSTVRGAIAARHSASNLRYDVLRPRSVMTVAVSRPHFVTDAASPTRFVPGGDHFMTTAFTSIAPVENSPSSREEFFADGIEP